jgi:hypothetical protein
MKKVIKYLPFILVMALYNCTHTDKKIPGQKLPVHSESTYNAENRNIEHNVYKSGKPCDFNKFINDPETPKLAKAIYLDKDWNLNNDTEALALLDSLTAKNMDSRSFYFKVVTLTFKKSDGYFSEGLGNAGKEFIENHTPEFATYFDNPGCFTHADLETWAEIAMLEFEIIISERDYNKPVIDAFINKLRANCKNCSPGQKEIIEKFGKILKLKWTDHLKKT